MSRQIVELESVMAAMVDEHKRLLAHLDTQQSAMKALDLNGMQDATNRQESSRGRIALLEDRRRLLVAQIIKLMRLSAEPTLQQIAAAFPQNGPRLLELRKQLKLQVQTVAQRSHVAGRLAAAVLGHLNTAVRLFADAVGQCGTYTKTGVPKVAPRIGVMDAVG